MDKFQKIQLQTTATPKGIEVIAITAGIGNGWNFAADFLQASTPLWDKAECYTDHTAGHHSVRDLGGILSDPEWDEASQGIRGVLQPLDRLPRWLGTWPMHRFRIPPCPWSERRYSHARRQADRAADRQGSQPRYCYASRTRREIYARVQILKEVTTMHDERERRKGR